MAAAALLLARVSRQGVASAAVAGMARRRPEAASLLGLSALAAAVGEGGHWAVTTYSTVVPYSPESTKGMSTR